MNLFVHRERTRYGRSATAWIVLPGLSFTLTLRQPGSTWRYQVTLLDFIFEAWL